MQVHQSWEDQMYFDKRSTRCALLLYFLSMYRKKWVEAEVTDESTRMSYIIVTFRTLVGGKNAVIVFYSPADWAFRNWSLTTWCSWVFKCTSQSVLGRSQELMYDTRPWWLVQAITRHTCPDPHLGSWNCLPHQAHIAPSEPMSSIDQQGSSFDSFPTFPPPYPHFNRSSGFWPCAKSCLVGGSGK